MPPFFTPRALFLNCLLLFIAANPVSSQQELPELAVSGRPWGEDIVGPYHQPRWSARGRFSADTDVYALPPYSLFLDLDYHGTFPRHRGKPDHVFVQELEIGLPYRFQIVVRRSKLEWRLLIPTSRSTAPGAKLKTYLRSVPGLPLSRVRTHELISLRYSEPLINLLRLKSS